MTFRLPELISVFLLLAISAPSSSSIPFIVLHGIGVQCANKGIAQFTELLSNGFCMYASFLKTTLYTEDWIGLKTLDDAGQANYISVKGNHLRISRSDMKKHIVPYLEDKPVKFNKRLSISVWLSSSWNMMIGRMRLTETGSMFSASEDAEMLISD